jgi:septal ring factor EnvC (AmiA/AmiB activator)
MKIQRVIILLLLSTLAASAQQSVRTKELDKQKKELQAEINNISRLLNENQRSISTVMNRLNLVTQQIKARKQLVGVLEQEITVLDEEIQFKEWQVKQLEKNIQLKKENYATSIRQMYKQKNNQDQLLFVLSAENMSQSFQRMVYLKKYADWRKKQSEEIVLQQNKITAEKVVLETSKKAKVTLADTKKKEEAQLQQEESTQKTEVANLQKNTQKLQTEINKKKKQAEALNSQIEKIIAAEVAASKKAAKSEPKTVRKAETTNGYAMTKDEKNLSSNFAGNKGKLPFPLKGNYKIISRFGQQTRHGQQINNNGIEIQTTAGNTAKAVFDGVVASVFLVPGTQTSVLIRHGNYLTFYSYLEQVYVKKGDKVKTGQDIGKIFSDREREVPTILHFELWKDGTKQNPELWLNK